MKEHLSLKRKHFREKKYWIENKNYILSALRNKAKQFVKKYANCKPHAKYLWELIEDRRTILKQKNHQKKLKS